MARKSRACAEAYIDTPYKQARRLTQPGRKRTISGRKLDCFPPKDILKRIGKLRSEYRDDTPP